MNFLAHYVLATRFVTPAEPLPAYAVGTALPDLLPLAEDRVRFRPRLLTARTDFDGALSAGVLAHLAADAAFHKTTAFAEASAEVGQILTKAAFDGIRVRRFFVAHVLTELVLDALLLRGDPALADRFYGAFTAADFARATRWAEAVTGRALPRLPAVISRFGRSQYLREYVADDGVAVGLSNTCRRARQDGFEGANFDRLVGAVSEAAARLPEYVPRLLSETAAGILAGHGENAPITTQK